MDRRDRRRRASSRLTGGVDPVADRTLTRYLSRVGVLRRAGWGVFDQGFVSLANFGLGVVVARLVSPTEFGAFGVVFATYLVALNIARGFATQPLTIRFGMHDPEEFRRASAEATGLALILGLLGGLGSLGLALVLPAPLSAGFAGLAIALPGLLVQDAWRFVLFTARRGREAMMNDLVWTLVLAILVVIVAVARVESVMILIACWGVGATAAAIIGGVQTRSVPRVGRAIAWWREHLDITPRFLSSELVMMAGNQGVFFAVGALAGLAAVGSLRGAQLLLGPFNVLSVGIHLTLVPEAARLRNNLPRLGRMAIVASGLLGLSAAIWGIGVLLLPGSVGSELLGESWPGAATVLLPVVLWSSAPLISAGQRIALRALEEATRTVRASAIQAVVTLVGGVAGSVVAGATGAAWGLVLGSVIATIVWWLELRRSMGERRARSVPDRGVTRTWAVDTDVTQRS